MNKLVRITTIPQSLELLLKGQLEFMTNHFQVIAISSKGNYLEQLHKEHNVMTYSVNMTRRVTPLRDILAIIKLVYILYKEKPHIVHTHTPKAGLIGMIASKIARVPVRLHTIAGLPLLEAKGFKRSLLNFIERLTAFASHYVFPCSINLKDIIIQNKLAPPHKVKVIGNGSTNGIDLDYFKLDEHIKKEADTIRKNLKIQEKDLVLLYVGRIVRDKGINELIDAFSMLESQYNNVKLLLVGNYEKLDPIDDKSKSYIENSSNIHFVGFQKDIRPYLEIADIFVFPSYREGFPQVVLQALSWNLPCVVTDINGSNEMVHEYVNGKIVPVKDTINTYNAIKELIDNEDLRSKLGGNSRKRIEMLYSNNFVWTELLSIYLNELDKK